MKAYQRVGVYSLGLGEASKPSPHVGTDSLKKPKLVLVMI